MQKDLYGRKGYNEGMTNEKDKETMAIILRPLSKSTYKALSAVVPSEAAGIVPVSWFPCRSLGTTNRLILYRQIAQSKGKKCRTKGSQGQQGAQMED